MSTPSAWPRIDGLEFVRVLGRGGQADVFQYAQDMPYRQVAVKVLTHRLQPGETRQAFFAEANLMASLEHPFIVPVYFAGITTDERPYLVMQYYPRGSLADRLQAGPLPVAEVLRIGVQIGGAVATAHHAGILHRDIKPQNLLVNQYETPGLSDFGIASHAGMAGAMTSFSAPWAPPEAFVPDGRASVVSDVYSLGATLWHLLAGRPPFVGAAGDSIQDLVRRIRAEAVPATGARGVPATLEALLQGMLAKDPARRPASVVTICRHLQAIEHELGLPVTDIVVPDDGQTRLRTTLVEPPPFAAPPVARPVAPVRPPASVLEDRTVLRSAPPPAVTVTAPPAPPAPVPVQGGRTSAAAWVVAAAAVVVAAVAVALVWPAISRLAAGPAVAADPPSAVLPITTASAPTQPAATTQPAKATQTPRLTASPVGRAVEARVLDTITVKHAADGLALDPSANRLYCANWGSGTVSVVDLDTREAIATIEAGDGSAQLALDSARGRLFVANSRSNDVTVIDTTSQAVTGRIPAGKGAADVALDSAAGRLYVADKAADTVTVIDTDTLERIGLVVGVTSPRGMAVDPVTHTLFVANGKGSALSVVDTTTLRRTGTLPVGAKPLGVTLDPASRRLYVANSGSDSLSVVDPDSRRVVGEVPIGAGPMAPAFDHDRGLVYVTNLTGDSVSVVDADSLQELAEVGVGDAPEMPLVDPESHLVYVSNWYSGTVSVLELS